MGWFSLTALIITLAALGYILWRLFLRGLLTPVRRQPVFALMEMLKPHTKIYTPVGDGPFPCVILLHGCGGPRETMNIYGKLAAANGVLAIAPDSNLARGIEYEEALQTVCTGSKLRAHERTGDLHAALEMAREDERVDASRIAIAGWSHGGWTALEAIAIDKAGVPPASMNQVPENAFDGVKGIFAVYPYCGFPARSRRLAWPDTMPVESLLVHDDTICNEKDALQVFDRQKEWGADIRWQFIENATHGFDEPDHHPTSALIYDPERAEIAHAAFLDFLRRRLWANESGAKNQGSED